MRAGGSPGQSRRDRAARMIKDIDNQLDDATPTATDAARSGARVTALSLNDLASPSNSPDAAHPPRSASCSPVNASEEPRGVWQGKSWKSFRKEVEAESSSDEQSALPLEVGRVTGMCSPETGSVFARARPFASSARSSSPICDSSRSTDSPEDQPPPQPLTRGRPLQRGVRSRAEATESSSEADCEEHAEAQQDPAGMDQTGSSGRVLTDGEKVEDVPSAAAALVPGSARCWARAAGTAWNNQAGPIHRRTCKHLKEYLGQESELARVSDLDSDAGLGSEARTAMQPTAISAVEASVTALRRRRMGRGAPEVTVASEKTAAAENETARPKAAAEEAAQVKAAEEAVATAKQATARQAARAKAAEDKATRAKAAAEKAARAKAAAEEEAARSKAAAEAEATRASSATNDEVVSASAARLQADSTQDNPVPHIEGQPAGGRKARLAQLRDSYHECRVSSSTPGANITGLASREESEEHRDGRFEEAVTLRVDQALDEEGSGDKSTERTHLLSQEEVAGSGNDPVPSDQVDNDKVAHLDGGDKIDVDKASAGALRRKRKSKEGPRMRVAAEKAAARVMAAGEAAAEEARAAEEEAARAPAAAEEAAETKATASEKKAAREEAARAKAARAKAAEEAASNLLKSASALSKKRSTPVRGPEATIAPIAPAHREVGARDTSLPVSAECDEGASASPQSPWNTAAMAGPSAGPMLATREAAKSKVAAKEAAARAKAARVKAAEEAASSLLESASALSKKRSTPVRAPEATIAPTANAEEVATVEETTVRANAAAEKAARAKAAENEATRAKAAAEETARAKAVAEEEARAKAAEDGAAQVKERRSFSIFSPRAAAEEAARAKAAAEKAARAKAAAEEEARAQAAEDEAARVKEAAEEAARVKAAEKAAARAKATADEAAQLKAAEEEATQVKAAAEEAAVAKAPVRARGAKAAAREAAARAKAARAKAAEEAASSLLESASALSKKRKSRANQLKLSSSDVEGTRDTPVRVPEATIAPTAPAHREVEARDTSLPVSAECDEGASASPQSPWNTAAMAGPSAGPMLAAREAAKAEAAAKEAAARAKAAEKATTRAKAAAKAAAEATSPAAPVEVLQVKANCKVLSEKTLRQPTASPMLAAELPEASVPPPSPLMIQEAETLQKEIATEGVLTCRIQHLEDTTDALSSVLDRIKTFETHKESIVEDIEAHKEDTAYAFHCMLDRIEALEASATNRAERPDTQLLLRDRAEEVMGTPSAAQQNPSLELGRTQQLGDKAAPDCKAFPSIAGVFDRIDTNMDGMLPPEDLTAAYNAGLIQHGPKPAVGRSTSAPPQSVGPIDNMNWSTALGDLMRLEGFNSEAVARQQEKSMAEAFQTLAQSAREMRARKAMVSNETTRDVSLVPELPLPEPDATADQQPTDDDYTSYLAQKSHGDYERRRNAVRALDALHAARHRRNQRALAGQAGESAEQGSPEPAEREPALNIRLVLPMAIQCNACGEYLYKGKMLSTRKEAVVGEDHRGIPIQRFIFKCTTCNSPITIKTDPQNCDYAIESGASSNFEPMKASDAPEEDTAETHGAIDTPPERYETYHMLMRYRYRLLMHSTQVTSPENHSTVYLKGFTDL